MAKLTDEGEQQTDARVLAAILYAGWHANKAPDEKLDLDHEHFLEEFFKFEGALLRRPELRKRPYPLG
jgi:hypothetical protein